MNIIHNEGIVQMNGIFGKNYRPAAKPVVLTRTTSKYDSLLRVCEELAALDKIVVKSSSRVNRHYPPLKRVSDRLKPSEIQEFIQLTQSFESMPSYCSAVGLIASKLIQNASKQGHRQFDFDLENVKPLHYFGLNIREPDLQMLIRGKLGENCLQNAQGDFYLEKSPLGMMYYNKITYAIQQTETHPSLIAAGLPPTHSFYLQNNPDPSKYSGYVLFHGSDLRYIYGFEESEHVRCTSSEGLRYHFPPMLVISEEKFATKWAPAAAAFDKLERLLAEGFP